MLTGGLGSIAAVYEGILCDLWGVLHNGVEIFPDAQEALQRFREEQGGRVLLISNAPRPSSVVRRQLQSLGLSESAYDGILTSGDMTRDFLKEKGAVKIFHLGPPRDRPLWKDLPITPSDSLEEASLVLCTGLFDDTSESEKDYAPLFEEMKTRRLVMLCANPDRVVMRGDALVPCAGLLAQAYQNMGGEVLSFGKPHPAIYHRAEKIFRHVMRLPSASRVLAIGDGVETDMRGAFSAKIDAMFITSGIHQKSLKPPSSKQDIAALFLKARLPRPPHHAMPRLAW